MNTSKKLNEWDRKKPLIIYGEPGSGKTTLALNLLEGYNLVKIMPENIENINIEEYILSSIGRKDVLQMFSNSKGKALYIEDFHIFKNNVQTKIINILKICPIPVVLITSKLGRGIEILKKHSLYFELKYTNTEIIKIIKKNVKTKLNNEQLILFSKECHSNLNIVILHLNVLKNDTDYRQKIACMTELLMNNKSSCDFGSVHEYNTIGLNFLTDLHNHLVEERLPETLPRVYDTILQGGIVESTMLNDSIYYNLLIIYNVISPHAIIRDNRNETKYIYKYNNYLSKQMICIHQNNILNELSKVFNNKNMDETLILFLKNDTHTLDISLNPMMKPYIFKRLNYLGSVLNININKKLLDKRIIK